MASQVKAHLTKVPLTAWDIRDVHERIPLSDPVFARALTSHLEHAEKGAYTKAQLDAIKEYISTADDALHEKYVGIAASRKKKKRLEARGRRGRSEKGAAHVQTDGGRGQQQLGGNIPRKSIFGG